MTSMTRARPALLVLLPLLSAVAFGQDEPAPQPALVPISAPRPEMPDNACRQRLSGWVEVEFAVLPDGRVADARVLQSQPPEVFDAAAAASVNGRLYAAQGAPVKLRERVLMTYADCRAEQLKGEAEAGAAPLTREACQALAADARAAGERFERADSGRAILADTVAQAYAAPNFGCPIAGRTFQPGTRWRAHVAYEAFSLISAPKAGEDAGVWVPSNQLKDVEVPGAGR